MPESARTSSPSAPAAAPDAAESAHDIPDASSSTDAAAVLALDAATPAAGSADQAPPPPPKLDESKLALCPEPVRGTTPGRMPWQILKGKTKDQIRQSMGDPGCRTRDNAWRFLRPPDCAYDKDVITIHFVNGRAQRIDTRHYVTGQFCGRE